MTNAILQTVNLVTEFAGAPKLFKRPTTSVRAVDGVSIDVRRGDILGIVGESGSGKSTLAKTILGLYQPTSGEILLKGRAVKTAGTRRKIRSERSAIQYVHQDPGAALDPWWSIGNTLHETLAIHGKKDAGERNRLIDGMLEAVGLSAAFQKRYPHELSGGQQRRIGIARALILRPEIVILDEPTSGLDLTVQQTVLKLIRDIQAEFNLTYLFISHDLSVVHNLCNAVVIMQNGRIVEAGTTSDIFARPQENYTKLLLDAAPTLSSESLKGRRTASDQDGVADGQELTG